MANEQYSIRLKATIDDKTFQTDIQKQIDKYTFKLKIDTSDIVSQIQNALKNEKFTINVGANVKGATGKDTDSERASKFDDSPSKIKDLQSVVKHLDNEGKAVRKVKTGYDELGKTVKEVYRVTKEGSEERISTTITSVKLVKQNEQAYADLSARLKQLAKNGQLNKEQQKYFNTELEKAKALTNEVDKKNKFKQLGRDISDAGKHAMTFGEMLKTAYEKFAIWSIATVTWYAMVRALKDVVKQVVELDTAFTKIQMVTGVTNAETQKLKEQYISLAKELKVTVDTVTSGADEFLRAGLNAKDATEALRASVILSTVANMNSADSTKYLIAAMNAYGLEASQLIDVVDKLSAVDVKAATSSAELGEALSLSASSAQLAGIGVDKYLGYLATVSETTRQSASTIGNSFKTIFARLQEVKIGSLVDEEGDDISNVDKVLKEYGIDLMSVTNNLESMEPLLDLLGKRWKTFTAAQKSEIATTVAGVRQRDKLIALLNNYTRAVELSTVATESAGSAQEKYNVYADSAQAKLNQLKSTWTEIADVTLKSGFVKFLMDATNWIAQLTVKVGGLLPVLSALGGVIAGLKIGGGIGGAIAGIGLAIGGISALMTGISNSRIESVSNMVKETESHITAISQERKEVDSLMLEYVKLAGQEKLTEAQTERLISLRRELAEAMGVEEDAIEDVVSSYEKLNKLYVQNIQSTLFKQIAEYSAAIEELNDKLEGYRQEMVGEQTQASNIFSWIVGTIINKTYTVAIKEAENALAEYTQKLKDTETEYKKISEIGNIFSETLLSYETWERTAKGTDKVEASLKRLREVMKGITDSETLNALQTFMELISGEVESFRERDFALEYLDEQLKALKEQKALEDKLAEEKKKQEKLEKAELKVQESLLEVEKARAALAEARNKKLRIFRAGQGFVYDEDADAVQSAQANLTDAMDKYADALKSYQDTMAEVMGTATEQAIKAILLLEEYYSKAQLDQSATGEDTLRRFFQTPENLKTFASMTAGDMFDFLKQFISDKNWKASSELSEDEIKARGEELVGGFVDDTKTGSGAELGGSQEPHKVETDGSGVGTVVSDIKTEMPESEKNTYRWDSTASGSFNKGANRTITWGDGTVDNISVETVARYGSTSTLGKASLGTIRKKDGNYYVKIRGGGWSLLGGLDEESKRRLDSNATLKYHTGGIVGERPFANNNEMFAKLLKDEIVLQPQQLKGLLAAKEVATTNSKTLYINTVQLNGVNDVDGLVDGLIRYAESS